MGIFGETVTLINRTTKNLNVRFDGRDQVLTPGVNFGFPRIAVLNAKMQNPLMGTEDPSNPTVSGCEYLVGVKGSADDCSPVEQTNARQRYNEELLEVEPHTKLVTKKIKINSYEARKGGGSNAE